MMRVREVPKEKRNKIRRGLIFTPKIFSYGAVIENVDLSEYLKNPTKISRALKKIYKYFKVDGVFCYNVLSNLHDEKIEESPQIKLISDIIKRINIMIPELPIVCEIYGPIYQNIETKDMIKIIEILGSAGLDILILREKIPSGVDVNEIYSSIANVANFFDLNPLIMIEGFDIKRHRDVVDLFEGVIVGDLKQIEELKSTDLKRLGYVFTLEWLHNLEDDGISNIFEKLLNVNPFLITTDRDLQPNASQEIVGKIKIIGDFIRGCKKMREYWNKETETTSIEKIKEMQEIKLKNS